MKILDKHKDFLIYPENIDSNLKIPISDEFVVNCHEASIQDKITIKNILKHTSTVTISNNHLTGNTFGKFSLNFSSQSKSKPITQKEINTIFSFIPSEVFTSKFDLIKFEKDNTITFFLIEQNNHNIYSFAIKIIK